MTKEYEYFVKEIQELSQNLLPCEENKNSKAEFAERLYCVRKEAIAKYDKLDDNEKTDLINLFNLTDRLINDALRVSILKR